MPRQPDLPCRSCGKLMWSSTTSLPEGQAMCQPCRRAHCSARKLAKPSAPRLVGTCLVCGAPGGARCDKHKHHKHVQCSECGDLHYNSNRPRPGRAVYCTRCRKPKRQPKPKPTLEAKACRVCGREFAGYSHRVTCSSACSNTNCSSAIQSRRITERYHSDPKFRDRVLANAHARRSDKLGKGSKPILLSYLIERDRICRATDCKFGSRRLGSAGRRPSIDHVIPLSRGGEHELANVQLTHYACNLSKNNRGGGEQLALIG